MSAEPGMDDARVAPEAALAAAGWKARTLPGFIHTAGPLWTRREAESWAYGILTGPGHANPAGLVHGGVLATLLDHTVSAVAWEAAARRPCVSVQLDTHFLAGVRPGRFVQARARVLRAARSLVFMQGTLRCDDELVATASAVMKIVDIGHD